LAISKSAIIDKAQKLASKGNIKEAIKEWKKLLSDSQDNGNIYNAIGDLQLKINMRDEAIAAYLEAADAFKEAGFELKSIALYKKTIKVDDSRHDIYEKLADVHAERGLVGNAIGDYLKAAKYYVKQENVQASLGVYRKMADLDPENFGIRIKIAEMCQKEGFEKEAVEEFGKVLTLYDGKGMTSEAEEMREKILSLDPDYFESQGAAAIAPPSLGSPETLSGGMLSVEDSESPGLVGPDLPQESSGPGEVLELDLPEGAAQPTKAELSEFEASFSGGKSPAAEALTAGELLPEEAEAAYIDAIPGTDPEEISPKKITESAFKGYLTEAEVYFKYGLNSKAIDQLLLVSKLCPDRVEPHLKLKTIYIQEGITEKAVEACCTLARIYYEKEDEENIKATLNELSLLDQDGNYRQELDEAILAFENRKIASDGEIGEDLSPQTDLESKAPESKDDFDHEAEVLPGEIIEEIHEETGVEDNQPSEWDLEPVSQGMSGDAMGDVIDLLEGERPLSEADADAPDIERSSIGDLVEEEGVSLSEELEISPAEAANEASFEGLSAGEVADTTYREASLSEPAEEPVAETEEQEEYVNLASILSEELGDQMEDSSGHEDTLLDGAFKELKKEVESTHNEKDMETHYDLGIAYKEMDMIPEAIKEFELASQGVTRFQDSVIMLASCYRSRGVMVTAIKTIQDALEDPRCQEDKRVPLLYEMAILVDLSGDKKKAGMLYEEVYQVEPEFRDVAKRRRLNEVEKLDLSTSESKSNTQTKKKNRISYI
jgi:tetratricopeptide (TPR) repeat protein